ncbi:hypothetical protein AAVH_33969, partial [Aphelenchoides avenae]
VTINELRIRHSVSSSATAVEDAITYGVQQLKVPKLQCLRVDLMPGIMRHACIQHLTRLQLAVPADDCRQQIEDLLVGNPSLEVGLQFLFGLDGHAPTLLWSAFIESVLSRLRDGTFPAFVHSLWIRSTFEALPSVLAGLQVHACMEDGEDAFEVYNIGTIEHPFSVFRCVQRNLSGGLFRCLYYYFVEAGWHNVEVKRTHRNFSEWLVVYYVPELDEIGLYCHWHPPTSARMAAIRKFEEDNS